MGILKNKIKQSGTGIFLYSLTPPSENISGEKLSELNRRRTARVSTLDIDGLSIYDVQDEGERNDEYRPFPYRPAKNPLIYGESLKKYTNTEQIIYLVSGKYSEKEINALFSKNFETIFIPVGSPSRGSLARTSLNRTLEISRAYTNPIGSIFIGERHKSGGNEVERMLSKIDRGVDFFISQCVFNGPLYEKLLADYKRDSEDHNYPLKPLILTFSPVGDRNGLDFMKWLGIDFSKDFLRNLPESKNFLDYTVQYLEDMGRRLIDTAMEQNIPIGLNLRVS